MSCRRGRRVALSCSGSGCCLAGVDGARGVDVIAHDKWRFSREPDVLRRPSTDGAVVELHAIRSVWEHVHYGRFTPIV